MIRFNEYRQEETLNELLTIMIESMSPESYKEFITAQLDELDQEDFDEVIAKSDHEITYEEGHGLNTLARLIIEWAKERRIIPNGNPLTQAIKSLEEVHELIRAIDRKDRLEIIDAYGDTFVTLVIGAYLNDSPLEDCVASAYATIKDRTGTLNSNGDFIRDKDE